jgi:sugar phosphate isomerase/epimerase
VIIPADLRAWSAEGINDLINDLKQLSERLKPYGIQVGYHNHHSEFNAYKDTTFWDYLAQNTPDDILLQLDLGWIVFAEQDPVAYIKRYQDRITTSHFKTSIARYSDVSEHIKAAGAESWMDEMMIISRYNQAMADESEELKPLIGQDIVPWAAIVAQYRKSDQPVWFVVEQEVYPDNMTPLAAVKQSLQGLKSILKE